MGLFQNFPWTNMHELNLNWIIQQLKKIENGGVISVNGQTGEVTLYEADTMALPPVDSNTWQIIRTCDGVVCGIHFNKDGNATIVNGNQLINIYTSTNQPPYPVTSVNGQTGAVELYQGHVVRLPSLTDEQLLNWNIYRLFNGVASGIQFENDGTLSLIWGQNRYTIYSGNNPPNYPVTSVEGLTGDVTLFPEAEIQFNDITDPNEHSITWFSMLNNKMLGIEIDDTGRAYIWKDEDRIPLYLQGIDDPSDFVDPTQPVLQVVNNVTTSTQWGLVRRVQNNDNVGFIIAFDPAEQDYRGYLMVNNSMIQLLTLADIPSQSGVVSINGKTGAVILHGEDITMTALDPTDLETAYTRLQACSAVVENGDVAVHNIPKNRYVIWKKNLYKATQNINISDGLSDQTNLQSVGNGGLNDVSEPVAYGSDIAWGASTVVGSNPTGFLTGLGRLRHLRVVFEPTQNASGWTNVLTLPAQHCPATYVTEMTGSLEASPTVKACRLTQAGVFQIYSPIKNTVYSVDMTYFTGS